MINYSPLDPSDARRLRVDTVSGTKLGVVEKKYIWVIVNRKTKAVYFLYDNSENDSRGTRLIREFLAERSLRLLTNNRKNSLFYGSERGVEMAVWFHSLVEQARLAA